MLKAPEQVGEADSSASGRDTPSELESELPPAIPSFLGHNGRRNWRLIESAEEFDAEFVELRRGTVLLRRADSGTRERIRVEALCDDDLYWLRDNAVPERFPAPVIHFQEKLVKFRLNLCEPPEDVEVRVVGTGVGDTGPTIPQNETLTYKVSAGVGLLVFDQGRVLPVVLDCALRTSREFPDTLTIEPNIRLIGKRIPFTPEEVQLAARKIAASEAKKRNRLDANLAVQGQAAAGVVSSQSSLRDVQDIFDIEHNAAVTLGASQQLISANAKASAAASLAGKLASMAWKDDVLLWAASFFEQAMQGAYVELDVIHRVRGIDYVAAIYRRGQATENTEDRTAAEGLPEFGQDTPYPVDDGEPGRGSTQFEVAKRGPELLEGKAIRWQGAYLTGLEHDPNWGRCYFLVRFAEPNTFLSPFDGRNAFYLVVSNSFAAEIASSNIEGRRLEISFLVRRDEHRDAGFIGHVFQISYFENGQRRVLRSK